MFNYLEDNQIGFFALLQEKGITITQLDRDLIAADKKLLFWILAKKGEFDLLGELVRKEGATAIDLNAAPTQDNYLHRGITLAWILVFKNQFDLLGELARREGATAIDINAAPTQDNHPSRGITVEKLLGGRGNIISDESVFNAVKYILAGLEEEPLLALLGQEQLSPQMNDLIRFVLVQMYLSAVIALIGNAEPKEKATESEMIALFEASKNYYNQIEARNTILNSELNFFIGMKILDLQEKASEFSEETFSKILFYFLKSIIIESHMYKLQDRKNILKSRAAAFLLDGGQQGKEFVFAMLQETLFRNEKQLASKAKTGCRFQFGKKNSRPEKKMRKTSLAEESFTP